VRSEDWSRKQWAIHLASMGFGIIPLSAGAKEPIAGSWLESKTTDTGTIEEWFENDPLMNYGVVPDKRHCIIDVDVKGGKPGFENLSSIETDQQMKDWLTGDTLTVVSPSKGLHFYLESPFEVGNSNSKFPEGIDIRGSGGYVVGPGSTLVKGRCKPTDVPGSYRVVNDDKIKRAPQWVVSRLRPPGARDEHRTEPMFELDLPFAVERAREFLKRRSPAIEGMGGDDHTYATIVQVKDLGVSEDMCVELLLEPGGWNDKCDPPWSIEELKIKSYNAYQYGNQRPGSKGGIMDLMDGVDVQDVSELQDERYKALQEIAFPGFDITRRNKRRESIIPYWLPAHGMVINLARRSWGKSVTMVDMALRIACDMDWHGLPVQEGRKVIYICGEDDEGLEEQIRAWCQYHGRVPTKDRFITFAGTVNLLSGNDVELWTRFLLDTWVDHANCIVFVDTWQRATSRGKQNDDSEMQTAVSNIEAMAKSLRGPAVVAFHPPKHDTTVVMGSSVIENSSVAIWQGSDSTVGKKLEVTRIKGKGFGNYKTFRFDEVELGEEDEFGNERTGVVPTMVAGSGLTKEVDMNVVEKARDAYASVLKDMLIEIGDMDSAVERGRACYMHNIADRIAQADGTDAAKILNDAGEIGLNPKNVQRRLKELFVDYSLPYEYPDGKAMLVVTKGTKNGSRKFELKKIVSKEKAA